MRKFHQYVQFRENEEGGDPTFGLKVGDIVRAWSDKPAVIAWVGTRSYEHWPSKEQTADVGAVEQGSPKFDKIVQAIAAGTYKPGDIAVSSYPAIQIKQFKKEGNIAETPDKVQQLTGVQVQNSQASSGAVTAKRKLYHLDQKGDAFIFTPAE